MTRIEQNRVRQREGDRLHWEIDLILFGTLGQVKLAIGECDHDLRSDNT
jgi:hypothetical protein